MFKHSFSALLLFAGGVAAQDYSGWSVQGSQVITLYAEGSTPQSVNHGILNVRPGATYRVSMELLRNDLGHSSEKMVSALLDGRDIGGCNPDGDDYDCTYFSCPTDDFVISSDDGTIDVQYTMTGHSYDCKCDKVTGQCASEHADLSGPNVVSTTAAVRFTLTDILPSDVVVRKEGRECNSGDTLLGEKQTMAQCADLCRANPDCRFFIFGHNWVNNKDGWCYQEFTESADCPEGWEVDDYTFYEILGREPTPEPTPAVESEQLSGGEVSPDEPNANNFLDWEMGVDGTDIYKCAKGTNTCLVNIAGSRHTFTEAARPSISMVDAGSFSHSGGDGTWSFADGKAVFSGANTDHSFSFAAGAVNL